MKYSRVAQESLTADFFKKSDFKLGCKTAFSQPEDHSPFLSKELELVFQLLLWSCSYEGV